jgi:hypothetical protein
VLYSHEEQIKPLLEAVLNLPPDSLQHEIALSQQLLELLLDYNIPPDLLSCRPQPPASRAKVMLSEVRRNVSAMQAMITAAKQRELQEAQRAKELADRLQREEDDRRRREQAEQQRLLLQQRQPRPAPRIAYFDPPIRASGARQLPEYARSCSFFASQ